MRFKSSLVLLLLCLLTLATNANSQDAAESVEKLHMQLLDVQAKEEGLRQRLQQLDESVKPENIERSLAGIGSTKPEELREHRRRQLTIERDNVLAQLKVVETYRQRLETAKANAETAAYHQSARPLPSIENKMMISAVSGYRWLMLGGGGFAALALAGGVIFYRRKIRLR